MTLPTKLTSNVPGDLLSTAAPLPAVINADGRSPNLLGTEGIFSAAGPLLSGTGILSMPNAIMTLHPSQLVGTFISITGAGANAITTPTAAQIVAYMGQQLAKVPGTTWPNTGTAATPVAYYPSFMFRICITGTSTIVMGTGCVYRAAGTSSSAANSGAFTAGETRNLLVVIENATPGAEAVSFFLR